MDAIQRKCLACRDGSTAIDRRTAANIFGLIYKCGEGEDKEIKLVLAKDDQ
jgi:hypothetical protein